MAAEPTPPGPPDDGRLDALEDRVVALEHYRNHEAPYASRAAGLGMEIVRQEAADLSVKLSRVIARQDQHEATLLDVLDVQRTQGELLERLGRVMDRHSRVLGEHGQTLTAHGQALAAHGQALAAHGESLARLEQGMAEILRRLPAPPQGGQALPE